ncbi:hypothetical protein R6Q57_011341 [Mikania cordata]
MCKNTLSELISIINSYDMDDKQRSLNHASSMGITSALENATLISSINYQASGSHNLVAKMIDVEIRGREPMGLGYSEVKPPFNHNYSILPKINKSVDDLLLKSDRMYEFTIGSEKTVSLTIDPILSDLNRSDDSEVCVEDLSVSGRSEEEEEKSVGRSTNCSVSSSKSHFSVPKVDFV